MKKLRKHKNPRLRKGSGLTQMRSDVQRMQLGGVQGRSNLDKNPGVIQKNPGLTSQGQV